MQLYGDVNTLTEDFRDRVEAFLQNLEDLADTPPEVLARWVSEEFSKFLVEHTDYEEDGKSDDFEYEPGPSIYVEEWDNKE